MKKKTLQYSAHLVSLLNEFREKGVSYVDGLIELQDLLKIDFDDLIEMLPENIIKKIKKDFIDRKYRIKLTKEEQLLKNIPKKESSILDFLILKK